MSSVLRSSIGEAPNAPDAPRPDPALPRHLRVAHRLLSPGRDALAEYRGWERLVYWRRYRTKRGFARGVVEALARPYFAAKAAHAGVRRFGAELESVAGVRPWRLWTELWWLRVRYNIRSGSYLNYQLYRPERRALAARYIDGPEYTGVQRFFYRKLAAEGDAPLLEDKRRFPEWCAEHGLPTVPVLAEWNDGVLVHDARPDGRFAAQSLFSKPPDMTHGFGTARWEYDGRGGYVGADGRTRTGDELLEELTELSRTLPPSRRGRLTRRLLLMPCL